MFVIIFNVLVLLFLFLIVALLFWINIHLAAIGDALVVVADFAEYVSGEEETYNDDGFDEDIPPVEVPAK